PVAGTCGFFLAARNSCWHRGFMRIGRPIKPMDRRYEMKKILAFLMAAALTSSLALAQTTGDKKSLNPQPLHPGKKQPATKNVASTKTSSTKSTKTSSQAHKGGKKKKKPASSTKKPTPPPAKKS